MSRADQPGQAVSRSVRPEDIDWQPFAAFPPSARLAVVAGHRFQARYTQDSLIVSLRETSGTAYSLRRYDAGRGAS